MKILIPILFLAWSGCGLTSSNSSTNNDLSYTLSINRSCSGRFCKPDDNEACETAKSFESQAAYCEGLRNDQLNNGCARRERKQLFFSRCGQIFEDINVKGWRISCPNGSNEGSQLELFPNRSEFCADLKTSVFTDCSTAYRNDLNYRYDCGS